MDADELSRILNTACASDKYVWLKHRFDTQPLKGRYTLDNGTLRVPIYLSFVDAREGRMKISATDVEWAHVSSQTTTAVMRDRLTLAADTDTLVRVIFSDTIKPQLMRHDFFTSANSETMLFGYFVNEASGLVNPNRSRIPLTVLLDIENTERQNSSVQSSQDYSKLCWEPNLHQFAERRDYKE